jgi:outer membrane receptor protein involved in Fe transport
VEVLRGPQAALFGRSTFSGAVNYITRDIRDVWESTVNARVGSDEDYKLSAWASGPIIEDKLKVYIGAGYEGRDGEWRNDLREGQANASNDFCLPVGTSNCLFDPDLENPDYSSLDFFNGPGVWQLNVPDIAGGEAPCPAGYRTARRNGIDANDAGCPPQRADNSKLGGESLWNATLKLEFTPTDNLEFTFKYEIAETDDDHFAQMYYEPVYAPVNGVQLAPGLNCMEPIYDPNTPQTLPDGTVLDGTYIPSKGFYCGEIKMRDARAQLNIPSFGGVATSAPGAGACILKDGNGVPILDDNGNFIPTCVSQPAPFVGAETRTQRTLLQAIYTYQDWDFVARYTNGNYDEDNVRDLERSYGLGPVTTGLFEGYSRDRGDNDSLEFRVSSPVDARLRGSLGYYWYKQDGNGDQRRFNSFGNNYEFGFSKDETEENNAVFGSVEFDLTDQVSFAFDWRYAEDTLTQRTRPEDPAVCDEFDICEAEATYYSFTPRFIVDYRPADSLNFYASLAKGNNPGEWNAEWFDDGVSPEITEAAIGINCDPSTVDDPNTAQWIAGACNDARVEEEETWTWEIGAKTLWMDDRLLANVALFYIDWTNQRINVNQCIANADSNNTICEDNLGTTNAGETRIYGAELELRYAATNYLTLGLAYGHVDSKLEEFFDGEDIASFNCNWWDWQASGGTNLSVAPDCEAQDPNNAAGQRPGLVPKHSANLSAEYTRPLWSDMEWFLKSFLNYESEKYVSVANLAEIGEVYIWDASLGLQGARWRVTAYVNNILDDDTPTTVFDFPIFDNSKNPRTGPFDPINLVVNQAGAVPSSAFLLTPRRGTNYGVTMQYRFGG